MPDGERIVLKAREAAHGLKVLYDDGHLLEFALFDEAELHLARVNDYRVLLDLIAQRWKSFQVSGPRDVRWVGLVHELMSLPVPPPVVVNFVSPLSWCHTSRPTPRRWAAEIIPVATLMFEPLMRLNQT